MSRAGRSGTSISAPRQVTLAVALRPFQVNPPAQFLNTPGGVAPVHAIARDGGVVRVDDSLGVVPLTPGAAFGASRFDAGEIAGWLRRGALPPA